MRKYIILLIAILLVLSGCNLKKEKELPSNNEVVDQINVDDFEDDPDFYNAKTMAHIELGKIVDTLYPDNYKFPANESKEAKLTFEDLEAKGIDLSIFKSTDITCNFKNSYIYVYEEDGELRKESYMDCTFKE